ncbi:hypothetical protein OU997_05240 [Pseudomonas sp. SL4(2022)]|uniref:hypothetical protein n=1 Tax=Pseudomonas sp. SL4(2022) TaxID=2994661 RepID=UPI00227121DB|nr:hypothetical protein [Pseudomonas sp. SL4(2022)]WAC45577.1 hypothetical protein OU997_05240 [Pseudomonas sp. SL4(2022)]
MYYAKVSVSPAAAGSGLVADNSIKPAIKFTDWLDSNPRMKIVGALLLGIAVGYFAGREHVKYEIKSAIQGSFSELAGAFSGANKSQQGRSEVKVAVEPGPVSASFIRKSYRDDGSGQDSIDIVLDFTNTGPVDIRAFDGVLQFTDLLGNKILDSKVAVNDLVAAGKILSWQGSIDYNQYIDRHKNFRFADEGSIKLNFVLNKVLYADGRLQEY